MNAQEITLSVLPGASEHERVVMVLCHHASSPASYVELRQQSFGAGLGWFNQSTIRLEPEQVADLRRALGAGSTLPKPMRQVGSALSARSWSPKLFEADSA
jgi:hypothetical protein